MEGLLSTGPTPSCLRCFTKVHWRYIITVRCEDYWHVCQVRDSFNYGTLSLFDDGCDDFINGEFICGYRSVLGRNFFKVSC